MQTILSVAFGFMAVLAAAAITVLAGSPSAGHPAQYAAAFIVAGVMLSVPFALVSLWLALADRGIERGERLRILGITLLVIGAARWLGILVAIGPVFAEGSLLLMALGGAFHIRSKQLTKGTGNA